MLELDEVDSTNNFLRSYGMPGDRRTVLVTAEYQSAGRGAGENRWESARGENLLLSLRLQPEHLPARRMFAVSELAALSLADALDAFLPATGASLPPFTVKWPNDIYHGDSKVAGMLIENDLQGALLLRSVIGIGINVNQSRFVSDAPNPRSLCDIVGHRVERRFVLEQFMERMMRRWREVSRGGDEVLDALHAEYAGRLYRRGEEHAYADAQGTFRATLSDVEPDGHLILRDAAGLLRRYAFKQVQYII